MKIRKAKEEELYQIIEVLNEATIYLKNKGIDQWSYPWKHEVIKDEIKKNTSYILLHQNKIIGTFSISNIDALSRLEIPYGSQYLSKIALIPEFQGKNIGLEVIRFACSDAVKLGKTLYLDCWAGNNKLKEFYSKSGLEYVGDFPEKDYFISVFKFN